MSELTDLELCKKIAEIEGYSSLYESCILDVVNGKSHMVGKALLFDLMVKYGVSIDYETDEVTSHCRFYSVDFNGKSDLPRAILECIIEANPSA